MITVRVSSGLDFLQPSRLGPFHTAFGPRIMRLNFVLQRFHKQASISSRIHKRVSISLTKVMTDFSRGGAFTLIIIFLSITTTHSICFKLNHSKRFLRVIFCEIKMQNREYMLNDPEWDENLKCFVNQIGQPIIYTGIVKSDTSSK